MQIISAFHLVARTSTLTLIWQPELAACMRVANEIFAIGKISIGDKRQATLFQLNQQSQLVNPKIQTNKQTNEVIRARKEANAARLFLYVTLYIISHAT